MNKILTFIYFIFITSSGFCQAADFTYRSTNGSYCTPASVKFTSTVSGNPTGYVWMFGNNNGSNLANPIATYSSPGTYTVRLIVLYKKSTLTVSKIIVINPAVAAHFGYDRNTLCTPGSVNFRADISPNISTYEWNFGDNSGTISTTTSTISHYFANFGTYNISLKVTTSVGCSDQSFTTVSVTRPSINATVSPVSGCIPATVSFNAVVANLVPLASVSSYTWDFGDGSPHITTTVANTSHIYQTVGNYIPRLHIITNEGCSNDFIFREISFGTPPTNHIAYPKKSVVCGSESPWFVSRAVNANKYFWDFGEGDTTSVTDTIVQHKFRTLGTKTITVVPLYNDCAGTPISFTIHVIGVIAGYDYTNTCANTKRFTFTNITQGNQSTVVWDFGDNSPGIHAANVIHAFPDTGTFVSRLSVTDSITGCSDAYTRNIYTANPLLTNPDTSICKNSYTTFSILRNYNNPDAVYNWNIAGMLLGPNNTVPFTVQATVHGIFNNNFVIIDNGRQYCPDTVGLNKRIMVRGPLLDFNAPASLCVGKQYNITNLSSPFFPSDLIHDWHWDYGITGDRDSGFQPRPYLFPYWGTFNVKLTAIDINGCRDTLVKPVIAYDKPFLRSIPDFDTLCAGQSVTLIAFHNDPITWEPSNSLSCVTCDSIRVNPSATTTYYVKATSRFNCTVTDSIMIIVHSPFTAVAKKTDNYICPNESVQVEVMPGSKKISWYPTTGLSDSTILNPIASPRQTTLYTAVLSDSAGCFSSSTHVNVYVKSLPTVDAGPDRSYSYNSNYSFTPVYSSNVNIYNWSPSALLSCINCMVPNGIATNSQTYTLTVISDSGCVATDKVSVFVECRGANLFLPTAFTPNGDGLNDYFYPICHGIQKIVRFSIYNRQGQLVFEAKDQLPSNKLSGWDGKYKGLPQTSAAYVYNLEAICEAGETLYDKGSFLLIR